MHLFFMKRIARNCAFIALAVVCLSTAPVTAEDGNRLAKQLAPWLQLTSGTVEQFHIDCQRLSSDRWQTPTHFAPTRAVQ